LIGPFPSFLFTASSTGGKTFSIPVDKKGYYLHDEKASVFLEEKTIRRFLFYRRPAVRSSNANLTFFVRTTGATI
jgi:hypothetical protein